MHNCPEQLSAKMNNIMQSFPGGLSREGRQKRTYSVYEALCLEPCTQERQSQDLRHKLAGL